MRHHDQRGGHHVIGHACGQAGAQRHRVQCHAGDIRHQPPLAEAVFAQQRFSAFHAGLQAQRGIDLTQLDAQPAQFYLVIATPEVVHGTVGTPARHVPAAIDPFTGHVRVGEEALGGQVIAAQVATRQLHAAQVQVAGHAGRQRPHARVEHIQAAVPDRVADRHRPAAVVATRWPPAHIDGGFGGAIQIVQLGVDGGMETVAQGRFQRLATGEHLAQLQAARGGHGQERIQHRRNEMHDADPGAADQVGQRHRVAVQVGRRDHQRGPAQQRQEEFPDRDVEGGRRFLQDPRIGADAVMAAHPLQAVDDGAVLHEHALGLASGAGGINDVGRILRLHAVGQFAGIACAPLRRCQHAIPGKARCRRVVGQDAAGLGRRQNAAQSLVRMRQVNRQVGRAGAQDRHQPDQQIQRAWQRHPHTGFAAHAHRLQLQRQRPAALFQLCVGEALPVELQCGRLRVGTHAVQQQGHQ